MKLNTILGGNMICIEKGVQPRSQYFFFNPAPMLEEYYYYVTVMGQFLCHEGYSIKRGGGRSPIVFYITEGTLSFTYEGKHYIAQKDDIVLMNCHKPHEYHCNSSCEFMFFHFDGNNSYQITDHLIKQNQGIIFRLETSLKIFQILLQATTRLYAADYLTDMELSMLVYNVLCYIQTMNDVLPVAASPTSNTMASVIKYIKNNINKPHTLESLASQVNLSKYYFAHLFKDETGVSPIEYVAQLRIDLAKTILKTSDRTISDIGLSLGYSSPCSFINAFNLRAGMSPSRFRRES